MANAPEYVPQQVFSIEDQINQFFDRVVECANHRRTFLLAEARDKCHEMNARNIQRDLSEKQLLSTKKEIERKLKENTLRGTQDEILVRINQKLAELRIHQPEKCLKLHGDLELLEQLMVVLGEIGEEVVPYVPNYQQLRPVVKVGKAGHERGELSNCRGIAIDENTNHIYVAEQNPPRVSIFSDSGEYLNSFTHQHMMAPYGIALHKTNVYVTDTGAQGVFHFKVEAYFRLIEALLGEGSAFGKFYTPGQPAVYDNGHVFIPDSINHRVQILDESLHFQRSITHESMHYPEDVKLTTDEVYILSSRDSPCVHLFSHTGEKIRSFITSGPQGMQVVSALFFCLDANNNIIISDGDANNVQVFSQDGALVHTLGGFQGGASSRNPQGVALANNLKFVVVAPKDPFNLQIFSC